MTIKGLSLWEWLGRAAQFALPARVAWALKLYAWQGQVNDRLTELERQNTAQWERIGEVQEETDLDTLNEFMRSMAPIRDEWIRKGAGL